MKFTRKQELVLIELGLNNLLRNAVNGRSPRKMSVEGEPVTVIHKPLHKKRRMSAAARKAISRRMKKMWAEKRSSE